MASCPAASAACTAACTDIDWPSVHASLWTARMWSGNGASVTAPITTMTSSSPAATAAATDHVHNGRPRNGASSLGVGPWKRVPAPAASTTAAVVTPRGRDGRPVAR